MDVSWWICFVWTVTTIVIVPIARESWPILYVIRYVNSTTPCAVDHQLVPVLVLAWETRASIWISIWRQKNGPNVKSDTYEDLDKSIELSKNYIFLHIYACWSSCRYPDIIRTFDVGLAVEGRGFQFRCWDLGMSKTPTYSKTKMTHIRSDHSILYIDRYR